MKKLYKSMERSLTRTQCHPFLLMVVGVVLLVMLVSAYRMLILHVMMLTAIACGIMLAGVGIFVVLIRHVAKAHVLTHVWPAHTHTHPHPAPAQPAPAAKLPKTMPARVPVSTPEASIAEDADKLARDATEIIIKDGQLTAIHRS